MISSPLTSQKVNHQFREKTPVGAQRDLSRLLGPRVSVAAFAVFAGPCGAFSCCAFCCFCGCCLVRRQLRYDFAADGLVSLLHCDGSCLAQEGATCPKLIGARCCLVVLAGEKGGRWSKAKGKNVSSSPDGFDRVLFRRVRQPEPSPRPCWVCDVRHDSSR